MNKACATSTGDAPQSRLSVLHPNNRVARCVPLLRPRKHRASAGGFTLIEVSVGILLMLIFLGATTQAFVVAAAFRIKGREINEATLWIESDLEDIKFKATNLNYASLGAGIPGNYPNDVIEHNVRCNAVDGSSGYGDSLRDDVLSSNESALVSALDLNRTSTDGNRNYILRRVIQLSNTNPHVVTVQHAVYPQDNVPGSPVDTSSPAGLARFYSEVIPNVSFFCP